MLTRLLLVENHADFRNVMRVLLGQKPDLEVVAKAKVLADDHQRCTELHSEWPIDTTPMCLRVPFKY